MDIFSHILMPFNGYFQERQTLCDPDQVRTVDKSEYLAAGRSLAEAFVEDKVARYPLDTNDSGHWSEQDKWDLHLQIMQYMTYAHCLRGLVTTIGETYGCVALWMPPGKQMDDMFTILRSGLWRLVFKLTREGRHRLFHEFLPLLHNTKETVLGSRDNDSYYLVYIGTVPSARGRGLAKKLIEHTTRQADRESRACYLESSNVANLGLYRRLGFEVKKQIMLTRAETIIGLDIMVREPTRGVLLFESHKGEGTVDTTNTLGREVIKTKEQATSAIEKGSKSMPKNCANAHSVIKATNETVG